MFHINNSKRGTNLASTSMWVNSAENTSQHKQLDLFTLNYTRIYSNNMICG